MEEATSTCTFCYISPKGWDRTAGCAVVATDGGQVFVAKHQECRRQQSEKRMKSKATVEHNEDAGARHRAMEIFWTVLAKERTISNLHFINMTQAVTCKTRWREKGERAAERPPSLSGWEMTGAWTLHYGLWMRLPERREAEGLEKPLQNSCCHRRRQWWQWRGRGQKDALGIKSHSDTEDSGRPTTVGPNGHSDTEGREFSCTA